jgi:hypothetical protein
LQRRETRIARIQEAKKALEERAREKAESEGKDRKEAQPEPKAQYNGNIKTLLRRGRGYKNLGYLLLKAQRMAVTKTEFIVLQKAA